MYAWTSCTHNRSLIHARLSEATKRLEACRLFFTEITTSVIDIEVDGNHKNFTVADLRKVNAATVNADTENLKLSGIWRRDLGLGFLTTWTERFAEDLNVINQTIRSARLRAFIDCFYAWSLPRICAVALLRWIDRELGLIERKAPLTQRNDAKHHII